MSTRSTFGTIKRIVAILLAIAIVLVAGIIVGQAPAIFGVEQDPEASIEFEDQRGDGTNVTIDEVSLSDGGFVVITDGGTDPIAVSDYLGSGSHENVTVSVDEDDEPELVGRLIATVHHDTTGDETYAYEETDGEEDRPYLENGFPVSDTATVTTTDDDALADSFVVESVEAPSTATTNETVEITAEIRNPTDFDTQQVVDFRVDGAVLEQQTLELDAGESREVTFQIDTAGSPPGEQTIGVYTEADGALQAIDLEFHTDPSIDVVDADDENVTVDVAIPEDGFVAIEDDETTVADNETAIGTSDELGPGEHENVTIGLEESVDEDEELAAVLYEGDPEEPGDASPIEHDDEPVETTFTIADVRAAAEEAEDEDADGEDGDAEGDEDGDAEGDENGDDGDGE
ncbi:DUF7282 domain-containing protein [Natrarchaeobius oligotrophus]|uniref:DUF4179 domain-containing protein n=1 Tax=Natrarchaeobius chitinivorans TaxID=1679083 RepID=A0A3N6NPA7_NATCH|nr:CARDB domain-containing protein [Natrarchaeobius chitinivorans]RQH01493.1 DUF4179 domain-containing protein [Natrarchaeobius chitinivorans]